MKIISWNINSLRLRLPLLKKFVDNYNPEIICLQELFTSLYFCDVESYENFKLAEPVPGPTTDLLSALAKELGVVIIASLFEKRAQGIYHNTTAVLDADGAYLGKYRKMHIPDDPAYFEKFYFTPGDLGYKVFKTDWRYDISFFFIIKVADTKMPKAIAIFIMIIFLFFITQLIF